MHDCKVYALQMLNSVVCTFLGFSLCVFGKLQVASKFSAIIYLKWCGVACTLYTGWAHCSIFTFTVID